MFSADFLKNVLPSCPAVKRFWTDSRSIEPGDLFVAIPGERFDGHDFILNASQRGAIGALVSRKDFKNQAQLFPSFKIIEVADTTQSLRAISSHYRNTLSIPLFAVGGSNGKTTTKEWLAFLLSQIWGNERVFKTEKSQNSILGIAMSLLQIRNEKAAIIEIGIDEPGWMDQHLNLVRPTHGLLTTIAEEHLQQMKDIETVAQEELKLVQYLVSTKGAFAANQDSTWIKKASVPSHTLTYGLEQPADLEGFFQPPQTLHVFGMKWNSPLPGKHNALNLLAALSALKLLQPDLTRSDFKELSTKLKYFEGEAHRSQWIHLHQNVRVFDDCYNANPDSMEKALQTFMELAKGCVQHLILGDMLDLGEASERSHMRILNLALVLGFDHLYLLGPQFKTAKDKISQLPKSCMHFEDISKLSEALLQAVQPEHAIFLKGSRGMKLEKILDPLLTKFPKT